VQGTRQSTPPPPLPTQSTAASEASSPAPAKGGGAISEGEDGLSDDVPVKDATTAVDADTELAPDELPDKYDLAPDPEMPPPPYCPPSPPPPPAHTDPRRRVSDLVAEMRALFPPPPAAAAGKKKLTIAELNAIADALVGAPGSGAVPGSATAGASDSASMSASATPVAVDPTRRKSGLVKGKKLGVASSHARPIYSAPVLLAEPVCAVTARVTYMTCYTNPETHNVVSVRYDSSIGADGQLCTACEGCEQFAVEYEEEEYTTIIGVYKAADGLGVAGLLHVTNMGKYIVCGDGVAQHSGMVTFGPEPNPGAIGDGTNMLALSSMVGVCKISSLEPHLQRITDVCFSQSECAGFCCSGV